MILLTAGCASVGATTPSRSSEPTAASSVESRAADPSPAPASGSPPGLDLSAHSTTDPASVWVVVNKRHPLKPKRFTPRLVIVDQHLVAAAAAADLTAMLAAASHDGVPLHLASTYRSYDYQAGIYGNFVQRDGAADADRYSARPGFSEHQTGLAIDVTGVGDAPCPLRPCFATTPAGSWVRANARTFGFILRYTEDNRAVTGYVAEPWHLRYVGKPLAKLMHRQHIDSLEQLFDVSGGGYQR